MAILSASSSVVGVRRPRPIPVFVINDNPNFVMALADYLHEVSEVRIIGSAVRLPDGLAAAQRARPTAVLIDPGFEAETIAQVIPNVRIALPSVAVLVLAAHAEEETRQAALAAGADAFISQWAAGDHLIGPIRACVRRQRAW